LQKASNPPINFGAGDANYFEPLLDEILIHFNKIMEAYQTEEEEE
jgi:hypothetical protein